MSSRRATGWLGSRMIRSVYASGSSPVAAASCRTSSFTRWTFPSGGQRPVVFTVSVHPAIAGQPKPRLARFFGMFRYPVHLYYITVQCRRSAPAQRVPHCLMAAVRLQRSQCRLEADMAEHEPCIGATDDWYTPRDIFDALGLTFDLDPCSPGPGHWVPARKVYTKEDDGLVQPWSGTVFMNPPFGRRNGHVPWLRKFLAHGDGVAIVRAYTSSAWFHQWAVKAQTMCFPRGKTKFIRPDGSIGRAPGHGVVLLGMGAVANKALAQCGLGFFVPNDTCDATVNDGEGTALAQMLELGNSAALLLTLGLTAASDPTGSPPRAT